MLRFLADPDIRRAAAASKARLFWGAAAIVGRSTLALAGPLLLGRGVDLVAERADPTRVNQTVLLMGGFALSTAFCQFWMRWLVIGWSRKGEAAVRAGIFGHLLTLPMAFHDRSRKGDLMSRLTSDVEAVRMGYGPGLMHAFQTGTMGVFALIIMLLRSPALTFWAGLPMLVLFLVLKRLMRAMHEHSTLVQEQHATIASHAQESFSGARVVKAFAREENEILAFTGLSEEYRRRSVALARTRAWFRSFVEFFAGLAIVLVLIMGGRQVIAGELSVGDYAAFNGFLNMLIWPAIALGWTLSLFQRAEAAEERLTTLRRERSEEEAGRGMEDAGEVSIRFQDLTFAYEEGRPVLHGITCEVPAGSTLGILGPTGSGKSTLARLLPRLMEPPPQSVFLNGLCIRDVGLDDLRRNIAMVPQETFLFSDTIRANITFGCEDAGDEAVARAIQMACLEETIASFPDGLDTLVGERGVTLSGGQRQRVALARALLMQAPLLLLDDSLSAVDTETEQRIIERILPVIRSRTTLLISHRVSTVRHADWIIVLDEGRIVEEGRHPDLLAGGGLYARIHRLQREQDELESL